MQLEPTGERVIEEFYRRSPEHYLIYLFHMATYNFVRPHIKDKQVLDYGCGTGYGTYHISPDCSSVVGIDIAEDAVAYAKEHYESDNLNYQTIEPAERSPLPFKHASFDTVLSFQVIEHIHDTKSYLAEVARVLKPGGILIVATPDRSTRLLPFQKPWNMWHVREYNTKGLEQVLNERFSKVTMFQMSGDLEALNIELRRTAKLKWMTLPFTLPIIPEALRILSLKFLKRLSGQGRDTLAAEQSFPFDESFLTIAPDATPSVNIIAVAHNH